MLSKKDPYAIFSLIFITILINNNNNINNINNSIDKNNI